MEAATLVSIPARGSVGGEATLMGGHAEGRLPTVAPWNLATPPRARLLILTLHGVGTPPPERVHELPYWVSRGSFEQLLDLVRERTDVFLTFDDGNRSDLERVLPALQARGLTALFFVCAGRLGDPAFLDRLALRALQQAGMEIGSHGMNHRSWPELAPRDLDVEIRGAKECLEDALGAPVTSAAVPFGAYNRRVLRAARETGFNRIFTSDGGPADPTCWLLPRNTVLRTHTPTSLEHLLAPRGHTLRTLRLAIKRWR